MQSRKADLGESKERNGEDLGRGVLLQFGSASVFMLSGTIFFIYLTKTLTTSQVGNVSLLLALVQFFSLFFSFGLKGAMEHYLSFYIGKDRSEAIGSFLKKYMSVAVSLSVMGFALIFFLAPVISFYFYHDSSHIQIIRILSVDISLAVIFNILTGVMSGLQRFRLGGEIYIISSVAIYGLALIFLILTKSIVWIIFGWIIGYIIGICLYAYSVYRKIDFGKKAKPDPVMTVLRYSGPLLAGSLLFFGSTYTDRLIVAFFLTLSDLGIYNLALLISQGLAFFINPLNNILLPKFSSHFSANKESEIREGVEFATLVLSFVYIPVSLIIASLSPSVLEMLGNRNYLEGSLPLLILVSTSSVFIVQYVYVQALSGIRKTEAFLSATAFSFIGNLLFSVILIPRFGIIGAAVSNSTAPAISFALILLFAHRANIIQVQLRQLSKIWLSAVLAALFVQPLQRYLGYHSYTFVLGFSLGMFAYLLFIKITKGLRKDTAEKISNLFSSTVPSIDIILRAISAE